MGITESRASVYDPGNRAETAVYPQDVFTPTDRGRTEIQGGAATTLPREALAVLVLLDGKQDVGHLEQRLPDHPPIDLRNVLRALLAAGLIRAVTLAETGELDVDFAAFFAAAGEAAPSPGAEASARREAEEARPALERNGYYVAIARRALGSGRAVAGLSALVVEDDQDVASLVARNLSAAGFEVQSAGNREAVLALLNRPRLPDVVVLDVQLPDLNGFELLQRMKVHPRLKAIPVIMLTADAQRDSIVRGLTSGADGYITKPFDPHQLVSGVKAILGVG